MGERDGEAGEGDQGPGVKVEGPPPDDFDWASLVGRVIMVQFAGPLVMPAFDPAAMSIAPAVSAMVTPERARVMQPISGPVMIGRLANHGTEVEPHYVLETRPRQSADAPSSYQMPTLYFAFRPSTVLSVSWASDVVMQPPAQAPAPAAPPGPPPGAPPYRAF